LSFIYLSNEGRPLGNLFAELRKSCEVCPDKTLYLFLNGDGSVREKYTYDEFLQRVRSLACGLKQAGIARFVEPVLLAYPQGIEVLVAFFACVHLGAIPVPVPAPEAGAALPTGLERLKLIQQNSGASTALTSSHTLARVFDDTSTDEQTVFLPTLSRANLNWFSSEAITETSKELPKEEPEVDQQPILFLQYTSGSTQRPRGVMVTHDNVLHNCRSAMQTPFVVVSWLPQFHDMGLIAACLFPVIMGGTSILFSSVDFLRRPAFWFETMTHYKAAGSVAPNFAFEYCLREDKVPDALLSRFDLSSVRELVSGAEPVHCDSFRRFRERFAVCGLSTDALQVAYGLAENTLRVSCGGRVVLNLDRRLLQQQQLRIDRSGVELPDPFRLVSAGKPLDGVEVRIVDSERRLNPGENSIGEIWISGKSKASGYWNNPRQTQEVFQAVIENDPERREYLQSQAETRVDVTCGDLAKPRLGLTSGQWDRYSTEISSVYHCGTNVDYIKPYASLRPTNVGSTLELLRLACAGRTKRFHLVSSTFIFGWSGTTVLYESDCNPEMNGLNFGYSQSKWTAEQLVREAAGRGLPVSIYRPSLVTASLENRYSRSDIMARTLIYMIRHGICTDCSNQLSFLPVDIVANNLIAVSLADRSEFMTTHLTADDHYNMPDVASVITRDFGYSLPLVSLTEFIHHINRHGRSDEPLFPLVPFFNRNYRRIEDMKDKRYDNRNYRRLRMQTASCLPEPSMSDTVSAMVKYLQQESLIPQPEPVSMGQP